MELKPPRRKPWQKKRARTLQPLPIIEQTNGERVIFTAHFDGFSVCVRDPEEMKQINTLGSFGKGNLSRNYPRHKPHLIRQRQLVQRKKYFDAANKPRKTIVVPDSDDENESYFTNLKATYDLDRSGFAETLNLTLEEAYFLMDAVKCLRIYHDDAVLDTHQTWRLFSEVDQHFVHNYVVYYYFRAKNWVVKPGIKFGGDFVLYKDGPEFYHASYVVVIDVINEDNQRVPTNRSASMHWRCLQGLNRMCGTAGKELLIAQIVWPTNFTLETSEDITKITIREVLMQRWQHSSCKDDVDNCSWGEMQ